MYSRNSSPQHVRAVHEAFESWVHKRFGSKVSTSTPCKPPRPPAPAAAGVACAGAAAVLGGGGGGGKRGRDAFLDGGGSDSDVSPSNLMKSKLPRQA